MRTSDNLEDGRARLRRRKRSPGGRTEGTVPGLPTVILDSSGTVLDSMGPRHSLAYFPAFADAFFKGSERVSLEEVWSFVALSSRFRSNGRFKLLASALRLARRHPAIGSRHPREEEIAAALDHWLASEKSPTSTTLERALRDRTQADALVPAAIWSLDVDSRLEVLPPSKAFEGASEAIHDMARRSRIVVAGEGRAQDTERDWRKAGLLGSSMGMSGIVFVGEDGGTIEDIASAAKTYARGPVLVVGDSPMELEAARASGTSFFPIEPGKERESWGRLARDFFPAFSRGERVEVRNADFLALFVSGPRWRAQEAD